jgi:two-component system, NarL family, nitrate/nitrite response regulator NarL
MVRAAAIARNAPVNGSVITAAKEPPRPMAVADRARGNERPSKITLVLADPHPIILDGLEQLFERAQDFKVLTRCSDGEEALQAVRKHRPDILLLDLRLSTKDGLAVLQEIKQEQMTTRVVLLTAAVDETQVLEAIRLGVRGVVLKEMAPHLLVQCLRKVHEGEQWLEKRSVGRLLNKLLQRETAARQLALDLTPREIEIVRLVARGLRNKGIAERLSVKEGTVKIHLHNIYEKLHVDGRLELTLYAQSKGFV